MKVVGARADPAGIERSLAALDARHDATQRQVMLVMDNGSCHTSKLTQQALEDRAAWLEVILLSRDSPHLNPKEREWRLLKRDHRGQLAPTLRQFVDGLVEGVRGLGGERCDVVDDVPDWWLAGHRGEPTGRSAGRPADAKDSVPRMRRQTKANLPAPT